MLKGELVALQHDLEKDGMLKNADVKYNDMIIQLRVRQLHHSLDCVNLNTQCHMTHSELFI